MRQLNNIDRSIESFDSKVSTVEILEMSIELVEVEECSEVVAREKSIVDAWGLSFFIYTHSLVRNED